jgi:hypothetical protein
LPSERGRPPFKGDSPYVHPQTPRAESSPTCSKALPCGTRAGSRMSCKPTQKQKKPNRRARRTRPPSGCKRFPTFAQTNGREGRAARRHATTPGGRASPTSDAPAWRPRPTRRATSAPVAACKQPLRHLCPHRTSSVAEPMLRLEATQCTTQQRQPGAMVKAAESGPAVMAVAGGRAQQSRRQPGSRPVLGQQEGLLPRREDGAPVIRSSNGSRTRNDRPANHSPRRINSAAGQAATLAGEADDASPSP